MLETLEYRRVLAAVPTVVFANDPPANALDQSFVRLETDPLIGQTNAFTLRFDNTSTTDTGFGPYVDLYMPVTGMDGAGTAEDDGISFVSATYLGQALVTREITLTADAAGVPHPFAKDASGNPRMIKLADLPGFKAGDKLVVLELPLGSVTPGQPPVDIVVTTQVSNKADLAAPLDIRAQAGFRFGGDSLNNPSVDPPLLGAAATQAFTPALFSLTKENLAPEYETATGPNFQRRFKIRVDVADGQTLTNLTLQDVLPNTLQFVSATVTGGGSVADVVTPSTTAPGGTLERLLSSITGTASTADSVMEITYYVPLDDASAAAVLNATTGDDRSIPNSATGQGGSWQPLDTRDPLVDPVPPVTVVTTGPEGVWDPDVEHQLVAKSIATQKGVSMPAGGAKPGALLTYTINFQVSDYFAFENLKLTDLLGDGQTFVPGSATLTVNDGHGASGTTTGAFDVANVALTPNKNPADGKDEIVFDVSAELTDRGFSPNGRLVGGLVPDGGGAMPGSTNYGGTTGTITFQAQVQNDYDGTVVTGDQPLDPGDLLDNTVTVSGDILNVATLVANGQSEQDGSYAWTRVPMTQFAKSVYAKNGVVGSYPASTLVPPGDTITYRITFTLPTAEFENLKITDYLPLPTFLAAQVSGGPVSTTPSATAPAAGRWSYGPSDTFRALRGADPGVSTTLLGNSVVFDFGTYDDPAFPSQSAVIDLLFTVEANAAPFADGLKLANRASATSNNSANEQELAQAIAEVTSSTPELAITKGIVATDNANGVFSPTTTGPVAFNAPGTSGARFTGTVISAGLAATPVNSDLSRVDNGDLVTYAIVVENRGSGRYGAFDTVIQDRPAAGLAIPGTGEQGINLRVTDGAGNELPFEIIGTGLFEGGIRLIDPSDAQGAIGRGIGEDGVTQTADGSNIVVVTYDMQVLDNVVLSRHINTAAVTEYAATEAGPDFTGVGEIADQAVVTIATDELITKALVSTEIGPTDGSGNNATNEAVIGELVTYRVTITVPEAIMPNAKLVDTLSTRMAFVDIVSVTPSPGVSFTGSTTPAITGSGRTVAFNLGTITNTDTDNTTRETITFEYRAVVLNRSDAQGGARLQNTAKLTFDGLSTPKEARAAIVTVIEPTVRVTKTAVFDDGAATGDAEDPLTYTIVLSNLAGPQASTADAFDVTFEDALPKAAGGSLIVGNGGPAPTFTVTDSAGLVTAADFELVGDDTTGYILRTKSGTSFDMLVGSRTITIEVKGKLPSAASGLVTPGDIITNTASALWSSLPDDVSSPRSPYNASSVERTGADGTGGLNDYVASSSADLQITGLGISKTVAATSEVATTAADRAVVGEIVRYRLVAVIPEGTAYSFGLQDQLPAGLQFLNDGTAKVAFVSNGLGITSATIASGAGLTVGGATAAGVSPTFVIPAGAILGGPTFGNGTDVTFDFGDTENDDTDADEEFIVLEFNAIVTNVAGNQAGTSLTNRVNVLFASTLGGTPTTQGTSSTVVRVSEPSLLVQKGAVAADDTTPAPGPYDAGDTVRYRIDITAPTATTASIAYDTVARDTLPATMALVPGSMRVVRNGTEITSGFATAVVGQEISLTIDEIAPGDEIQLFYEVVLNAQVDAGGTTTNTVDVGYTSLPGGGTASNPTGSTVPGAGGAADGERTGAGGVNDYSTAAETSIIIASPELEKAIIVSRPVETTSVQFDPDIVDFAVGEIVTYRLTVTLPEGTTTFNVADLLPTADGRMQLTSATVSSIGANVSGSSLAVGDAGIVSGGTITFDFGTVVNLPDNTVTDADRITIDVVAQVMNVSANQDGDVLVNSATLDYGFGTATATASGEVIEPELETVKEIVTGPSTTAESVTADAGDIMTFRVTVRHTANSHAPAYSVEITDTLPTGLELVHGSVRVITHPNYPSSFYDQPVVTEGVGGDSNALSVFFDYIDQPDNEFANGDGTDIAVIEYQARVTTALVGGSTITNTADVAYDSLFRRSSAVPEQSRAYDTSDTAEVVTNVVDLSITKTDGSPTYVPGRPITYTIVVSNDGAGFVRGATVSDAIPAVIANPTWTVAYIGTGSAGPASGSGDIAATIDLASGGTAAFTVTGTVLSTATGNLVNTATVTTPGNTGDPTPGNNTATDTDTPAPEADLRITKTDGVTKYSPGVPLTYTIVVTNDGPSFVTAARVIDDLPAVLTGVSWTVAYSGTGSTGVASGTGDIDTTINLAAGGTATFTVTASVDPSASGDLVNTARVQEPAGVTDRTPGNNTATDTDEFQPLIDLAVTKTNNRFTYVAGGQMTYTIVVSNAGPGTAVGARVVDAKPAQLLGGTWTAVYSAGSSGDASGTSDATNLIDATITLLPGGTVTFTHVVNVSTAVDLANTRLQNSVTVTPPPGGIDTNPGNNTATDTDTLELLVTGTDIGCDSTPTVTVVNPFNGEILKTIPNVFERRFRGGVRVALGDLDDDGEPEILVAPGPGRLGEIKALRLTGAERPEFRTLPFGPRYRDGIELAAGNVDGDLYDDVVASKSRGASLVKVFRSTGSALETHKSFAPFPRGFRGGASVAIADVGTFANGSTVNRTAADQRGEIIVGSGIGMAPSVLVYDVTGTPRVVDRLRPLTPSLRGGVAVSAHYFNGDGLADIAVAGGRNARSAVEVYDGATKSRLLSSATFASLAKPNVPVYSASVDLTGDGRADGLFQVQGDGGKVKGIRRVNPTTGAVEATLAPALAPPLRIASRVPRRR